MTGGAGDRSAGVPEIGREPGAVEFLLAAAATILAALLVGYPSFRVPHWYDDQIQLEALARFVQGETGLVDYLLAPHNDHVLPLYRAWFLVAWRLFGLEPAPWHATIALFQAASGFALFALMRRFSDSPVVPLFASAAWAGAAIGGWDGPLCWIASSLQVPAGAALLAAMACATRGGSPTSRAWATGMGFFLALSVLWMGAMLVVLPIVLVAFALSERGTLGTRSLGRFWLAAGILPVLLVGIPILLASSRARAKVAAPDPLQVVETSRRFVLVALNSVAGLSGSSVDSGFIASVVHPTTGVLLAALLAAVLLRRRIDLRVPFLVGAPAAVMTLAALVARRSFPTEMLLSWGRYRYLPTLALIVGASALLGGVLSGSSRRRRPAVAAGIGVLLGVFLAGQVTLAKRTAGRLLSNLEPVVAEREALRDAIRALSDAGRRQGEPLRFPDGDATIGVVRHSLAHFRTFAVPEARDVSFVPVQTLTDRDRERCREALDSIRTPAGSRLRRILQQAGTDRAVGPGS